LNGISRSLFLVLLSVLLVQGACGKKGPPFIPENVFPLKVEALKGTYDDAGTLILTGIVRHGKANSEGISGCIVYHALYPLDEPPCEGCPVKLAKLKTIRENVVSGDRFRCQLQGMNAPGIHFIRIRLLGEGGIKGPPSERIKLSIPE
jgi:predicted small lipoprotein YifL